MIYIDFEYRGTETLLNNKNKIVRVPKDESELVLLCYKNSHSKVVESIDLRTINGREIARNFIKQCVNKGEIFVSFNAIAEIGCFLSLGLDIQNIKIIDLMIESKMIALTHRDYYLMKGSLLETLKKFNVKGDHDETFKFDTRALIVSRNNYSKNEWDQIVEYGKSDVYPLSDLFKKIISIHNNMGTGTTFENMIYRGEVIKATIFLDWNSKGFPIDEDRLEAIFGRIGEIKEALAIDINNKYSPDSHEDIYQRDNTGNWVFKTKAFSSLIKRKNIQWEVTENGLPVLKQDYLQERIKDHPYLVDLYRTRRTFNALTSTDMRKLNQGGYIRAVQHHFAQVTSRSSPKPSQGYLLNLTPWLRSALIRPQKGEVFIGIDWKSQEVGVAAAISGDIELLDAYKGRDVYLALAVKAGAIPPIENTDDAWKIAKKGHSSIRQNFKSVQLGINYGKGLKSLAQDILNNSVDSDGNKTIELIEAERTARKIYEWHQRTFRTYWKYIGDKINSGRRDGFTKTKEGWVYFINSMTRDTQLKNFPSQSEASHMLHRAVLRVYQTNELEMVCSLHDAIYIRTTEEKCEQHTKLLKECMSKACEDVIGTALIDGDILGPYTYDNPYWDERGREQYSVITKILGDVMKHPRL